MKKIIMSTALAAVFAVSAAQAENFKGAYAGLETGAVKDNWKLNVAQVGLNIPGKTRIPVGVNLGYQTVTAGGFYMAGQLDALMTFNSGFSLNPGITAKAGYKFGERFVLAGMFGVTHRKYELLGAKKSRFTIRPGVEAMFALDAKNYINASYQYSMGSNISGITTVQNNPVAFKAKPRSHTFLIGYKRGF